MIRCADYWIGTRFFHPPIIWICQRLGLTQHAFSRYAWLAATLTIPARIGSGSEYANGGFILFAILAGVVITVATACLLDVPTTPLLGLRLLLWFIASAQIIAQIASSHFGTDSFWAFSWTMIGLFAEYAKTISTIPPRKPRATRPNRRSPAPSVSGA